MCQVKCIENNWLLMQSLRRPGHAPHIEVRKRIQGSCVFAGFADKRRLVGLRPFTKEGGAWARRIEAVILPPQLRSVTAPGASAHGLLALAIGIAALSASAQTDGSSGLAAIYNNHTADKR